MEKIKKVINYILYFISIAYFLLLVYPQLLFENKIENNSFIIYYNSEINKNIYNVLRDSEKLLSASPLFKLKKKQRVFLCNNKKLYTFFALFSNKSFAINNSFTKNIFIANSDPSINIAFNGYSDKRSLSGIITHETCHTVLNSHLGLLRYYILPNWKNEGYCDYVAKESSYDYLDRSKTICNKKELTTMSFKYFKYRLYIEYLIDDEDENIYDILNQDYDIDSIENKIITKFCSSLKDE